MLTENFTLEEMTVTNQSLDNTPTEEHISNLKKLCMDVLEPIRAQFGVVRVNSGFRSAAVNKAVGGSSTSQHTSGEAADIVCNGGDLLPVAEWIRDNLVFDQLILESWSDKSKKAGWIHVSYKDTGNRKQVLTMRREKGKVSYIGGLPNV